MKKSDPIEAMTNWAEKMLHDRLVSVWCDGEGDYPEKEYEIKILTGDDWQHLPDKVKKSFESLPEHMVLADLVLYGWEKGRGPLHVVFYDESENVFRYLKREEERLKEAQGLEDDLESEDLGLIDSIRNAGPGAIFPVKLLLDIYAGSDGRRTRLLETLLLSSEKFSELAVFEKKDRYNLDGWTMEKKNIPKLYRKIENWDAKPRWGEPSKEAKELMGD